MVSKPTIIPVWAQNDVVDPISGQNNVLEPPNEKKLEGWARLEYPPRNWFNWLFRYIYLWIQWLKQQEEQAVVTEGNGVGLFPIDNALITLTVTDIGAPTSYLFAVGVKRPGQVPSLNVVSSNILTLGTGTITGNQPINGALPANAICWGQSKIIPS